MVSTSILQRSRRIWIGGQCVQLQDSMLIPRIHPRLRYSFWAMVVYLAGFSALISVVSHYFLIPAILAAHDATPAEKRLLSGSAALLMAVLLFILCVGILIVFRVRRFFFPQPTSAPSKTQYVDSWAEAGKRANTQSADQ
jgi:hypothetical protein